jgi:hypothetical protein
VVIADILAVVQAYFKDWPSTSYVYMYDLNAPYNPQSPSGTGQQRIDDILAVLGQYFVICPAVDTEVALATKWAMDMDLDPSNGLQPVPQLESEAALEAIGYYRTTTDVPGQGVHYVNNENWDGVFDPTAPEGLVYVGGRLSAQLYVADAPTVGLGTHGGAVCDMRDPPGPPPFGYYCDGAEYGIELEDAADGPQCDPACSWIGPEEWHLHHFLCSYNIGTPSATAIPGSLAPSIGDSEANCQTFSNSVTNPDAPECTVPVTAQPCWSWSKDSGWMGHLYNWIPNANRIPDVNGTMNGRFADCFPDEDNWKATNCPG